jgi:hypothetical protein
MTTLSVILSEVEESPVRNLGFLRGILRLRCAPLRMTVNQ